jgi:hypothetical protein
MNELEALYELLDTIAAKLVNVNPEVYALVTDARLMLVDHIEDPARIARLEAVLTALMTNPHLDLGDCVYTIREREGDGWDGPAVAAWGDAVSAAKKALNITD